MRRSAARGAAAGVWPAAAAVAVVALALALAACSEPPSPRVDAGVAPPRWPCPGGWVASARGGCGPAALLCVAGGGAAPGACDGVDVTRAPVVPDGDGGAAVGFHRGADGGLAGGWREVGVPGGPPRDDDVGIGSCPPGWSRAADRACDPRLRADCPAGSAALPGGACTDTAETACPAGEFPDPGPEAVGATVVHVRADAAPGGDGSAARPVRTLAEGLARAGEAGWVLVARGAYAEAVTLARGVRVVGACPARVTIAGVAGRPAVAAGAGATGAELRGVTIAGAATGGVRASDGARVAVRRARIERVAGDALHATGADTRLVAEDVVVAGTRAAANGEGTGAQSAFGAEVALARVAIADAAVGGVRASGIGSRAVVRDAVVAGAARVGLLAVTSGRVDAARVVLERNARQGVIAGFGATVAIADAVIRGSRPWTDGSEGNGIRADRGGIVRATGVLVDDSREVGVVAVHANTSVTLEACVVRGTRARASGVFGRGLDVAEGAAMTARGVLVLDNREVGARAANEPSVLTLEGSVVRATQPRPRDGRGGDGLHAIAGGRIAASRVVVEGNAAVGAHAQGARSTITLDDAVVRDTRPRQDGRAAEVVAELGATVAARRVVVERAAEFGASAIGPDATLDLTDVALRAARGRPDGFAGLGLVLHAGARVRATRVLVAGAREFGVALYDGEATFDDVVVAGVAPSPRGFGVGVMAAVGARLNATRLAVVDVAGAGVESVVHASPSGAAPAAQSLEHVFVRGVLASTIRADATGTRPTGLDAAYALHAQRGSQLGARWAVFERGGHGFYNAFGRLALRDAVITAQRAAGVSNGDGLTTEGVVIFDNDDDAIQRDVALPEGATLPPPERICLDDCP